MACATTIPEDFAFDIACNATPVGMRGDPHVPHALDGFRSSTVVTDVVTDPALTPWVEAAWVLGMKTQTGVEMVEAQFDLVLDRLLNRSC